MKDNYLPGLDTLRSLAILLVVFRHYREILGGDFFYSSLVPWLNAGWIGVELFFVLSGYLIASQSLVSFHKYKETQFLKIFYIKRAFRILPVYYSVLALYFIWPSFREHPELDSPWKFIFFTMNYGRNGEAFSHAWSLCIEEHFYLCFPLFLIFCPIKSNTTRPFLLLSIIFLIGLSVRQYLWFHGAPFYPFVYRPTHTHLDGLLIGVCLALLNQSKNQIFLSLFHRPTLCFSLGIVLVILGTIITNEYLKYVWSFTLISVGFGSILIAFTNPKFLLAKKILGANLLANLAFTLYLTHKQAIHLVKISILDFASKPILTLFLSCSLIFAFAYVLHFIIEKPFLHFRNVALSKQTRKELLN